MQTGQILIGILVCFMAFCDQVMALNCFKGQYYHVNFLDMESCLPCPVGTFMSDELHQNFECRPCQEPELFNHERVVSECTLTSNTVLLCDRHHYRVEYGSMYQGECKICTICGVGRARSHPYQRQPCGGYDDTKCSRFPN